MENNELYHYGVKGMKWGVRRTPAQLGNVVKRKKATSKNKSDGENAVTKVISKLKAAKQASAQKAEQKKAADAEKEKQDAEAEKKRVLSSGSAAEVLKYKGQLTNQELQNALNRINMERQLSEITGKETKTGLDKVEDFMGKVDRANQAAKKGIDAWNTIAKVANSLTEADLPTIDGQSKAKKAADEAREKLIKSGSAKEISKHFGSFSSKELGDIVSRMNYEDKIRERLRTDDDTPKSKTSTSKSETKSEAKSESKTQSKTEAKSQAKTENNTANYIKPEDFTVATRPYSSTPSSTIALGQSRVAGLLGAPKDDD